MAWMIEKKTELKQKEMTADAMEKVKIQKVETMHKD